MSSSDKEIFDAFKPLIDLGIVGVFPNLQEDRSCKVIYDRMITLDKVLSSREFQNIGYSNNMKEAIKNGCKTNEEIMEYCNKIGETKKDEAVKCGKPVIADTIGMFSCKVPHEECSWDVVYELATPEGEFLYERNHCY